MFYTHISGANSRKLVRVVRKRKPELCTIRVLSRLHPNSNNQTIRGWDFCFEVVVSFERIWKQNRFVSDRPLSLPISNTIALRATLPCRFNLVYFLICIFQVRKSQPGFDFKSRIVHNSAFENLAQFRFSDFRQSVELFQHNSPSGHLALQV